MLVAAVSDDPRGLYEELVTADWKRSFGNPTKRASRSNDCEPHASGTSAHFAPL